MKKSISLIGMAGAGKSSLGKELAKHFDFNFIDSDKLIETIKNKPLQEILDENGIERLLIRPTAEFCADIKYINDDQEKHFAE